MEKKQGAKEASTKKSPRKSSLVHNHERAEANWGHAAHKTKAVGFFARHMSDRSNQREILSQFIARMKNQKQADKHELDKAKKVYEHSEGSRTLITTLRPPSPVQTTRPIPSPDGPAWKQVSQCGTLVNGAKF